MADEKPTIDDTMSRVLQDIEARETKTAASESPPPSDATAASVEQTTATVAAPEATNQPAGDRPRGPDGKFIAKTADAPAAPATPTPDRAEPTAATAAPSTAQAVSPPVSWSAEAKAAFAALSPAVQQAVLKREKEVSDGFAQKSAELKTSA